MRGESFEAGLVAGGRRDLRTGAEEVEVDASDRIRVVTQEPRRPQLVREVVSPALELGGQPAVQHDRSGSRPDIDPQHAG